jgi:hypothetical protein
MRNARDRHHSLLHLAAGVLTEMRNGPASSHGDGREIISAE